MPLAPSALIYLVFVGVFLPYVSLRSAQRLRAGTLAMPPRRAVFTRTLIMLVGLGALAILTGRSLGLPILAPHVPTARDLGAAAIAAALVGGWAPIGWRLRSPERRRRMLALVPQTPGERALWFALTLAAGFFEEIIYRGVLFAIVMYLVRNWGIAALICAAVFAAVHAIQGLRSAIVVGVIAFLFQALVRVTGSLYEAMAVHFLYDLVLGLVMGARAQALAAEADSAPATAGSR